MSIFDRLLNRKSPDEITTITVAEFQNILQQSAEFIDMFGTEVQINTAQEILDTLAAADKALDQDAWIAAWADWNALNVEILHDNDLDELLDMVGEGLVRIMDPSNN